MYIKWYKYTFYYSNRYRWWCYNKNITFQKQENEIAFTLKTPFETDAEASVGIMNVVRQIPEGADFIIEACNNAYDTNPTWEDVTRFVREGRKLYTF